MAAAPGLLLVCASIRALDLVGRPPASSLALAREAREELHASMYSSWCYSSPRVCIHSEAAAARVRFRGDDAWLEAASRGFLFFRGSFHLELVFSDGIDGPSA